MMGADEQVFGSSDVQVQTYMHHVAPRKLGTNLHRVYDGKSLTGPSM